jgi:hypothetical protein
VDTADSWSLHDDARDLGNPTSNNVKANNANAENASGSFAIDFLSNGFKLRNTDSAYNASGGTYVFAAFARSPFKTANAR